MNLETKIQKELFNSIRRSYESQQWKSAILDAIYHLADAIRDKSGLQSDGAALAGQAFGGKNPKLKLNRLETETEQNIQSGFEQIVRGLFQAIRNPRSHENVEDNQSDCDSIVIFIDYILRQIGSAKSVFSIKTSVEQIMDDNFVPNERYANLIISEIPRRHLHAVTLQVIKQRTNGACSKLNYFVKAALLNLNEADRAEIFESISNELRETTDEGSIRTIFQILERSHWSSISEIARLRIENYVIENLKSGKYNRMVKKCIDGALATWSTDFWPQFTLKEDLFDAILLKLKSENQLSSSYAIEYAFNYFDYLHDAPKESLDKLLIEKLERGDKRFYNAMESSWLWENNAWSVDLMKAKENFVEAQETESADDMPF